MDPRDRIFGPIASVRDEDDAIHVEEFGDLVRKLVLSEEVVLESIRLREFPLLIQKFGFDGMKELLQSRRFRVHCDAVTIGQTGQTTALESRARKGAFPPGSYCFDVVRITRSEPFVHENLQPINDAPGLRGKQAQKLRRLVAGALLAPAADAGEASWHATRSDLDGNSPILKTSVALAVRKHFNRDIAASAFDLRIERIDDTDWRTETNLGEQVGLDVDDTHQAVAHGLLGVGGLNQRIEYMERYQALTGFRSDDLPLLEEKLGFFWPSAA